MHCIPGSSKLSSGNVGKISDHNACVSYTKRAKKNNLRMFPYKLIDTYTSQSDVGIGLSENQTDTESIINMTALEIDSPDKLLSHTAFGDLLDFGPALSPPTHSVSSPSGHSNEMLTVKLDTLCITKMLDMTQNMQGYLSQLLVRNL